MIKKVALITGASGGIGKATAVALAEAGYDLCITYRTRPDGLVDTAQQAERLGAKVCMAKVDIADLGQIDGMFQRLLDTFGRIDLMVNNAGVDAAVPFLDTTPQLFEKIIHTNFRGAYFASQRAAREMIRQNTGGVILNVSSVHAESAFPDSSIYAASKAAMTRFTKNIAVELADYSIRVLAVHPGYIDVGWSAEEPFYSAENRIPMRRFGTPREVADLMVFLASDKASYMTGGVYNVDGGVLLPAPSENAYFEG